MTGANLVMDYVMSNAAVSRGFNAYLGTAIGVPAAKWRFTLSALPDGFNQIDVVAVVVVLTITLIICYRYKKKTLIISSLNFTSVLFFSFSD